MKHYKPITPSLRHIIREHKPKRIDKNSLREVKSLGLISGRKKNNSGRNNQGIITIRHRGGGHKQLYRNIDFRRNYGQYSLNIVERIEYNPLTSGFIALLSALGGSKENKKWYILAPRGLKTGDVIKGEFLDEEKHKSLILEHKNKLTRTGESIKLKDMEIGSKFFNLDGRFIRSAGTSGELLKIENMPLGGTRRGSSRFKCLIRLPSSKMIEVEGEWKGTLGEVSNKEHSKIIIGKAGANRWRGKRPTVRGEAMNAVDHPHGGKSHGSGGLGNPQKTKWGKLAKYIK